MKVINVKRSQRSVLLDEFAELQREVLRLSKIVAKLNAIIKSVS